MRSHDRGARNAVAVLLAGGEGTGLRLFCRQVLGREVPKQFAALVGSETLFEQTLRRTSILFDPAHTVAVLMRGQEEYHGAARAVLPKSNLVVQPADRGTAIAILSALLCIAESSPGATAAIFPCDHYFGDEPRFMRYVESALSAANEYPGKVVLMGAVPDAADPDYGWIDRGRRIEASAAVPSGLFEVRRFWEKPSMAAVKELMHQGWLWNTMVAVGRVSTMLLMIAQSLPSTWGEFALARRVWSGPAAAERPYERIAPADFSRDVLAARPRNLAAIELDGVFWTDLGEPGRVRGLLARLGRLPGCAA